MRKYPTIGTVPKSNRKFIERGKIDTPKTVTSNTHNTQSIFVCVESIDRKCVYGYDVGTVNL